MTRSIVTGMLTLAIMAAVAVTSVWAETKDLRETMEKRVFKNESGESLPYRLFVPEDYDRNEPVALILFLHGAGERGDDNQKQLKHAQFLRFAQPEAQAKQAAIIVAPQCPAAQLEGGGQHQWVQTPWGAKQPHQLADKPSDSLRLTFGILDALEKEFNIDPQRRYVTGLSMGGYGTFDALMRRPQYWAAGIPICGGGADSSAATIAHIPLWAFHGDADGAVPVGRSRSMVAALKKAGGEPRYTEYEGAGHGIWGRVYEESELVDWLYAQTRTK